MQAHMCDTSHCIFITRINTQFVEWVEPHLTDVCYLSCSHCIQFFVLTVDESEPMMK